MGSGPEVTDLAVQMLSRDEARSLTDEVKSDAERLWRKLLELYEGGAHEVLGYSSWGAYFTEEFGGDKSYAYRLLDSARVIEAVRQSPIGDSVPANEAQARELAPLLDQPEDLQDAWAEATENGKPTAAKVKAAVKKRKKAKKPEVREDAKSSSEAAALDLVEQFYKGVAAIHYVISIGTKEVWLKAEASDRHDVQVGALDLARHLHELSSFLEGVERN